MTVTRSMATGSSAGSTGRRCWASRRSRRRRPCRPSLRRGLVRCSADAERGSRRVVEDEEELGADRIGSRRPRHRDGAPPYRFRPAARRRSCSRGRRCRCHRGRHPGSRSRARADGRRRRRRSRTRRAPRSCRPRSGRGPPRARASIVPVAVSIVTDRVSPAASGAGWAVGHSVPPPAATDGAALAAGGAEAPGWALHAALAMITASKASERMGRGIMRQPPGRREGRWHRRGGPPRG